MENKKLKLQKLAVDLWKKGYNVCYITDEMPNKEICDILLELPLSKQTNKFEIMSFEIFVTRGCYEDYEIIINEQETC